ncbi:MAG: DNA replication and repair protein RecF [Patescibacteria group bacterium]|jgi:DNA replication and repair protein RecF
MYVAQLSVSGFRNISSKKDFILSPTHTIIIGKNAVGKTNLLEALCFVNRGKGFRETTSSELISENKQSAHVNAVLQEEGHTEKISAQLKRTGNSAEKHFLINDLQKPYKEYRVRTKPVVLFAPTDLDILTSGPDLRRSFIDTILQTADYEFVQAKNNYERGLYKRNKMLQNAHFPLSKDAVDVRTFWDNFLIKHASYMTHARQQFVDFLNEHNTLGERIFRIEYKQNIFSHERVAQTSYEEERYRRTVVGPQLDDFLLFEQDMHKKEKDLAKYGSRSEQRLVVLWLKMNELLYYDTTFSVKPLFLVDDIFSELDSENSRKVLAISKDYQTCMTTAHEEILSLIDFPFQKIELQ